MSSLTNLVILSLFLSAMAQAKTNLIDVNESALVEATNLTFACTQQTDFTRTNHYLLVGHSESNINDTKLIDLKGDSTFSGSLISQVSKKACLDLKAGLEAELASNGSIPAQRHEQMVIFSNTVAGNLCFVQGGQTLTVELSPRQATLDTLRFTDSNVAISSESKLRYGFFEAACADDPAAVRSLVNQISQDHLL